MWKREIYVVSIHTTDVDYNNKKEEPDGQLPLEQPVRYAGIPEHMVWGKKERKCRRRQRFVVSGRVIGK